MGRVLTPERVAANLKFQFGLTPELYEKMLAFQANSCAICELHVGQLGKKLEVDHCHKLKFVRGLLCHACNVRVGCYESRSGLRKDHPLYEYVEAYVLNEGVDYDFL